MVMDQVVVVVEVQLLPPLMVPTSWVVEVDLESFLSVVVVAEVLPEYYVRNRHRNRSEKHWCLSWVASEN